VVLSEFLSTEKCLPFLLTFSTSNMESATIWEYSSFYKKNRTGLKTLVKFIFAE